MKQENVRTCALSSCGLPFIVGRKRRKNARFCSLPCYWIWKRESANRPYPMVRVNGEREYLHRYIYKELSGDTLTSNDIVHHKDENPYNRDFENLEKISGRAAHLHKHNYHKRNGSAIDNDFPF